MAILRPRAWLAGGAAALTIAAGALAAGAAMSMSSPASPPGVVTISRALPGGIGTLSLTAQWTSRNRHGDPVELGGLSAHFSTCHRGGFLDLKQYCVPLANPFFTVLGVTSRGGVMFRITTSMVQDNDAYAHRSGWIVPIDRRTGTLYRLAVKNDLIVQLWAVDTTTATLHKLGEIRD